MPHRRLKFSDRDVDFHGLVFVVMGGIAAQLLVLAERHRHLIVEP